MLPSVYACKNRDADIRQQSTSGGVFTLLAQSVFLKQGTVYGAVFDEKWRVTYSKAIGTEGLEAMRGSKYPQAYVGEVLKDVQRDLKQGLSVLFVGTPCQIQGLKLFLGQEYKNLLCVDFICFGVGSPGLWGDYLNQTFSDITVHEIRFKDKRAGWHRFTTVIKTDRKEFAVPGSNHPFLGAYLAGCNIRPSCFDCRFKGTSGRSSDLTISDSWGIDRIAPEFDDDKGISNVFINTAKGALAFEEIRGEMDFIQIDFEQAIQGNPYYFKNKEAAQNRDLFWKTYRKRGVVEAFQTAVPQRRLLNRIVQIKRYLVSKIGR